VRISKKAANIFCDDETPRAIAATNNTSDCGGAAIPSFCGKVKFCEYQR
jgi:hypothetical protein